MIRDIHFFSYTEPKYPCFGIALHRYLICGLRQIVFRLWHRRYTINWYVDVEPSTEE